MAATIEIIEPRASNSTMRQTNRRNLVRGTHQGAATGVTVFVNGTSMGAAQMYATDWELDISSSTASGLSGATIGAQEDGGCFRQKTNVNIPTPVAAPPPSTGGPPLDGEEEKK